jgi:hypothetical protein
MPVRVRSSEGLGLHAPSCLAAATSSLFALALNGMHSIESVVLTRRGLTAKLSGWTEGMEIRDYSAPSGGNLPA